jgi:hypothetical protein
MISASKKHYSELLWVEPVVMSEGILRLRDAKASRGNQAEYLFDV